MHELSLDIPLELIRLSTKVEGVETEVTGESSVEVLRWEESEISHSHGSVILN